MKMLLIMLCSVIAAAYYLGDFKMSNVSEERCVTEMQQRIRATHADYHQLAIDACRAAEAVAHH